MFRRRYDLEDGVTMSLNPVVLFLILVYIYPLKFMADFVVDFFTGAFSGEAAVDAVLSFAQVKWLYVIYGGFFAALYGVFALLYAHALRRADDIGLNPRERSYTRFEVEQGVGVGLLSGGIIALAFILPAELSELSPFVGALFALMGVNAYVCGVRAEARAQAAERAAA